MTDAKGLMSPRERLIAREVVYDASNSHITINCSGFRKDTTLARTMLEDKNRIPTDSIITKLFGAVGLLSNQLIGSIYSLKQGTLF